MDSGGVRVVLLAALSGAALPACEPEGPCVVTQELDVRANGWVDYRETWTYDEAGRPIKFEDDLEADGTIGQTTSFKYDSEGRLLAYTSSGGGYTARTTYEYVGDLLVEERDGDRVHRYGYDEAGRLVSDESDWDGDGVGSVAEQYSYDSAGLPVAVANANGTTQLFLYDDHSNLVERLTDDDGDQKTDERSTWTYTVCPTEWSPEVEVGVQFQPPTPDSRAYPDVAWFVE